MTDKGLPTQGDDLITRIRGWIDGFDRHELPSTWVARELMSEALVQLDGSAAMRIYEAQRTALKIARDRLTGVGSVMSAINEGLSK